MSRPTQLRAGSTHEWTESFPYTAADGWTVKGRLLLASGTPKDYTVTSTGESHTFTIPASLLIAVPPGRYEQVLYAEKGSGESLQQVILADTYVDLLPSLSGAMHKSFARTRVENLEATLTKLDQQHANAMSHGQRQIIFREIEKIRAELQIARAELEAEEMQRINAPAPGIAYGRFVQR